MIRVIVADDEERICRLIQALVDWKALDMEVSGIASNGTMALELIEEKQPDILITDIRMPGCNGLELMEKARKSCPMLQIIVISGYAQFEYAQTAMKYGVCEYLLKPINQKELTETLSRIKDKIEERNKEQEASERLLHGRAVDIYRLRSVLLQELSERPKMQISEKDMREQYHLDVQNGMFQIFCLKLSVEKGSRGKANTDVIMEKAENVFDSRLKKICHDCVLLKKDNDIYGMVNYGARQTDVVRETLRSCLNQMEAQKKMLGDVSFSLGIGKAVKSAAELGDSMILAKMAVLERLLEGTGKLLECTEQKAVLHKQTLLEKYDRGIRHALEMLSMEESEEAAEELYQAVIKTPFVHGWEIWDLIRSAGEMFVMRLAAIQKESGAAEFVEKCEGCNSVAEVFEELKSFQKSMLQDILTLRENEPARPVRLAKQYIQNHYSEQITLEEVSEAIGLSPAYFSVLFKKETEVGFARYLMNVRMEEAKILLRETNLPVAEICKKVGYNDLKHFTRTFEKIAEVKPAVFRKLYG